MVQFHYSSTFIASQLLHISPTSYILSLHTSLNCLLHKFEHSRGQLPAPRSGAGSCPSAMVVVPLLCESLILWSQQVPLVSAAALFRAMVAAAALLIRGRAPRTNPDSETGVAM